MLAIGLANAAAARACLRNADLQDLVSGISSAPDALAIPGHCTAVHPYSAGYGTFAAGRAVGTAPIQSNVRPSAAYTRGHRIPPSQPLRIIGRYELTPTTAARAHAQAKCFKRFHAYGHHRSIAGPLRGTSSTKASVPRAERYCDGEFSFAVTLLAERRCGEFFRQSIAGRSFKIHTADRINSNHEQFRSPSSSRNSHMLDLTDTPSSLSLRGWWQSFARCSKAHVTAGSWFLSLGKPKSKSTETFFSLDLARS